MLKRIEPTLQTIRAILSQGLWNRRVWLRGVWGSVWGVAYSKSVIITNIDLLRNVYYEQKQRSCNNDYYSVGMQDMTML